MKKLILILPLCLTLIFACKSDDDEVVCDPTMKGGGGGGGGETALTDIPYEPKDYDLKVPDDFPTMEIPVDNALTEDGVNLGRHLFYDPILSADSTMSCSSCHLVSASFTDNLGVSTGIDGIAGNRSSMSLLNVGFYYTGLFWDGRTNTLEEQALQPIEDPVELHNTWTNVIDKLKVHPDYPILFRKAFGITTVDEITKELAAKAIASFERIMVSSGQAPYDRIEAIEPGQFYSEMELEGRNLFFNETGNHPGCSHCHDGPLLTTNEYLNNGSQLAPTLDDYADVGRGMVTGDPFDNGKFRVPTLRNIALTAPYMHNGQFETLEEVLDHYASGGLESHTSPDLLPFDMTIGQRDTLIAFLNTFTDMGFVNNPALQNPFE